MAVTVPGKSLADTCRMERLIDEAEYVLRILCRMRDEVSANPEWFEPDARERIDKAITRIQLSFRPEGNEFACSSVKATVKAA